MGTMRQIKFRAQDIASNKWLYGDLRHHKDDVCIFEQEGNKGEQAKRDTIGQFVGLKDKNGKEIYEGDIVTMEDFGFTRERPFIVVYDNFDAGFKMKGRYCHVVTDLECEVIGNIHDNPEFNNQISN